MLRSYTSGLGNSKESPMSLTFGVMLTMGTPCQAVMVWLGNPAQAEMPKTMWEMISLVDTEGSLCVENFVILFKDKELAVGASIFPGKRHQICNRVRDKGEREDLD